MYSTDIENVPGTEYLVDIDKKDDFHQKASDSDIILIPQPSECVGRDPLTWSKYKKYLQLFLVSLYACAFSFGENTLGAAWSTVAEDTGVSIAKMNGGSALNYLLLGFVNIFWIPMAMKIGRRPVFLLTTIVCLASGVWTGEFHGVAQWMLSCVLNGIGTSAYQAVIQLTVFDMFFVHESGRMISVYLFGQQLGSVIGLVSGGSIADSIGWRWSQYLCAIIDAVVFVLLFFLFEETLFPRFLFTTKQLEPESSISYQFEKADNTYLVGESEISNSIESPENPVEKFKKRSYFQTLELWCYYPEDKTTYWQYFKRPFFLFTFPSVVISGFIFAFGCTAGIVSFNTISEILAGAPYDFSARATGLICLSALVGNIIGYITGVISDNIVIYLAKRNNGVKEPEMRLYTLVFSFVYAAVGYQMYGWGAQEGDHWIVVAIGLCLMIAHQVSACGIATSYVMDSFRGISGELVVVLAICSSLINFAISYSVQPFINRTNYGFAFLFFGLCVLGSMLLAIPVIIWGKSWRKRNAPRYYRFLEEVKK